MMYLMQEFQQMKCMIRQTKCANNFYCCFVDFLIGPSPLIVAKKFSVGVSTKLLKLLIDTYAKAKCFF